MGRPTQGAARNALTTGRELGQTDQRDRTRTDWPSSQDSELLTIESGLGETNHRATTRKD